jgi:hypothetical protein
MNFEWPRALFDLFPLPREAICIWTTGDFDAAEEVYSFDYVHSQHHDPDGHRDVRGVEAMKIFAAEFRKALFDFRDYELPPIGYGLRQGRPSQR